MVDRCSDWECVFDRVGCGGKEACALPGVFSVTDTGAGFILLVLSICSAEGAAVVEKLCKGAPMEDEFLEVKTISDAGVGLAGCREGNCLPGMLAVV